MRLHTLRITAFGPFAGTETVDFDALGADGLFLLHGETGAGKTTVLDAVAFALFGAVPGARSEAKRLLSDHAEPQARPEVELELTVGGRRIRIVRSPEHQRAKRRGAGTTKEQARVSLTWLDEPGSEGLTRLPEVGQTVAGLLGMSAEQFFQVALLPQGEFAKFLRANTDDRAALLQRLFDTQRFGGVEAWFVEQRRASAARVASARTGVRLLLGKLATAAGVGDPDEAEDPRHWAAGLLGVAQAALTAGGQRLEATQAQADTADAALAAAEARAVLLRRKRAAQGELADWAADTPRRRRREQELSAARRAEAVARDATQAQEAAAAASTAEARAGELGYAVRQDADGARGLADDLAAAVGAWRSEIGRLTELTELAERAEDEAGQLKTLRSELEGARTVLADLDVRRAALPGQQSAAERALQAAQQAETALPALTAAHERACAAAEAADQLVDARRHTTEAADAARRAAVSHLDARQYWLDLRERRLDGMAAELAGTLQRGRPCAVCGGTDHPRPAVAGAHAVSRAAEQQALAAEQSAAQVKETSATALHACERQVAALLERTGGDDREHLRAVRDEAASAYRETQTTAGGLGAAKQQMAALQTQRASMDDTEREIRGELATGDERCRSLQQSIAEAGRRLRSACGDDPDVHARRLRLQKLADSAADLLVAQSAASTALTRAEDLGRRAASTAVEAGFTGLDTALAAVRPAEAVRALEQLLTEARDVQIRAQAVLDEADVAATPDLDVDLSAPRAECEAADRALAVAHGAYAEAQRRLEQVRDLAGELDATCTELEPELARDAQLSALADVINGRGQNSRHISLHAYVLAARLEEVAAVASVRLRRMSGGRFEFVHSDAPGARGTRGGLGLDIRDDYTGAVRSTKTLSGGESFLASLALALGLADVVSGESGGVPLDTLFIDEGFGTLDAATLEEVMAVLDDLRAGGRVVGLVSHVDELRQRIPNRLFVRKGRTGSRLELSSA